MPVVVHYVGGPRDGDSEMTSERLPERQLHHIGHGRVPVSYGLFLVEVDRARSVFVYAVDGMTSDVIQRIVGLRVQYGEIQLAVGINAPVPARPARPAPRRPSLATE